MGIFDQMKNLAKSNPEQADQVFDKLEEFADQQTGNQYDAQVEQATNFAREQLGLEPNADAQPTQAEANAAQDAPAQADAQVSDAPAQDTQVEAEAPAQDAQVSDAAAQDAQWSNEQSN